MATQDKKRQLVITELRAAGGGTFTELPQRFAWDSSSQTSHRGSWEYELTLRTVKEHYAGTNRPTEQVLGWHWEPFQMEGFWDNRYAAVPFNDASYAENTRKAFEKMVKRGNYVRVEFESLSVTGLISKFRVTYRTQYRIGWAFTFSPHLHGDETADTVAPQKQASSTDWATQLRSILDQAQEVHLDAPRPLMTGTLYTTVNLAMADLAARMDTVDAVLSSRVLLTTTPIGDEPVSSVSRVAASFGALASSAAAIVPLLTDSPVATALAFLPGEGSLAFQAWSRELSFTARALYLAARLAQEALLAQASPDALALYRPSAGESLYAVSNRFYRTPHRWRDIATRNGLKTMVLSGSEFLVIPNRRAQGAA